MKDFLGWCILALDQLRRAGPADLDAAIEIGLRARHTVQALGPEAVLLEDLRVRMKGHLGAAAIVHGALVLQLRRGMAARIALNIERALARDLDLEPFRQRIDDRYA